MSSSIDRIGVTYIGGPTVRLDIAGLRLLTDPTFDAGGVYEGRGVAEVVRRFEIVIAVLFMGAARVAAGRAVDAATELQGRVIMKRPARGRGNVG